MSANCVCPPAAELPDIGNAACAEKFANITRYIIGRVSGGAFTDIGDETEFDLRLAAADATKIVLTPFLSDVEFPSSEIIKTSKDDKSSPFGRGFRVGESSPTSTAMFKNTEATLKDDLKALECYDDLAIALVDSDGALGAIGITTLIPITNFFVGTRGFGGIDEVDTYTLNFDLAGCWDAGLVKTITLPTWNANNKLNS